MKVINLKDLKIEKVKDQYSTFTINIDCPDLDSSIFVVDNLIYNTIYDSFKKHMDDWELNEPIVFEICVNNYAAKFDMEDIKSLVDMILASFNNLIVEKERRDREYRFGLAYIPKFNQIRDTQLHVMKMVNYKTKVNIFNLIIKFETKDGSESYYYNLVE